MKARKTWAEKLCDNKGLPKVATIEGKLSTRWGKGTFVVPSPLEVKELMDKVPKGKLTSINELREALARKHGTTIACPITTGIFAWIAANAAEEAAQSGARRITPYWRTLKNRGELNPKYPGGIAALRKRLEGEGHSVRQKGKRYFVENFSVATHSF
ncbi:MAG: hypothetical protein ACXW3L_03125 [Limisphaerales bacterium]